jgi:hypothetical protein
MRPYLCIGPLSIRRAVRLAAIALFLASSSAVAQSTATLYAVTPTNRLLTFSSANPGVVLRSVPITNLGPTETVVGIDGRPANKLLYGLGSNSQLTSSRPSTRISQASSWVERRSPICRPTNGSSASMSALRTICSMALAPPGNCTCSTRQPLPHRASALR